MDKSRDAVAAFDEWVAAQPADTTFDERLAALEGWLCEHPEYTK